MRAFGWLDAITGLLISSSLLHSFSKYYIEFNNFIYQDQVKILLLQVFDRIHLQVIIHKFSLFLKDFMAYAVCFVLASILLSMNSWSTSIWHLFVGQVLIFNSSLRYNLVDQARLSKGYIHVLQFNGFFFPSFQMTIYNKLKICKNLDDAVEIS